MRQLNNKIFACLLILISSVSLPASQASGQRPVSNNDWPFGHEGLNLLIQETGIKICSLRQWNSVPRSEKFMLIIDPPGWMPSRRSVPAMLTSQNRSAAGLDFRPLNEAANIDANNTRDYFESTDCPIIRPDSNHPIFKGVDRIICNRPGYLARVSPAIAIADTQAYPIAGHRGIPFRFSVIDDQQKFIAVADRNLFTNQMLFKGDNLLLAENILAWLSNDFRRKNVLLIVGGRVERPVDESDLEIETPVPTRAEVLAALKNLPADKMVEFANSVAAVTEDEQLLNDMAHKITDQLRPKALNRILLLALFASCCLFGLITYFLQRKILRKTSSDVAGKRQRKFDSQASTVAGSERRAAASMVLNAFCLDVANRRLADWAEFPAPLDLSHDLVAKQATHEMADAFWSLKTKPNTYWTRTRLLELEASAIRWRELIQQMDTQLDETVDDLP